MMSNAKFWGGEESELVLQFPGLISGVESMKEREEEERKMDHRVNGLARRTGLYV